jgi:serine/threonine protein kinase
VPTDLAITFKLGDLGICKLASQMNAATTVLADWIRAPETIDPTEFGPLDHRMDIYHCGLLSLQILLGRQLTFTRDEVLAGKPRSVALALKAPHSFALEKALRRHVAYRTATAMEFWRDFNTPAGTAPQPPTPK